MRPELLSGDEEARLEFTGATADLAEPSPYLVVDVGGGSTEFIVGTDEPDGAVLHRHRLRPAHRAVSCTPTRRPPRS